LIISDPTVRGIHTAKRIRMLVDELHLEIENCAVIINRASDTQSLALQKHAEEEGLQIAGIIPHDPEIAYFDLQGRPVFRMSHDAKALQSLFSILDSFHIP
jgi:CO dehydrogenase maturation factor